LAGAQASDSSRIIGKFILPIEMSEPEGAEETDHRSEAIRTGGTVATNTGVQVVVGIVVVGVLGLLAYGAYTVSSGVNKVSNAVGDVAGAVAPAVGKVAGTAADVLEKSAPAIEKTVEAAGKVATAAGDFVTRASDVLGATVSEIEKISWSSYRRVGKTCHTQYLDLGGGKYVRAEYRETIQGLCQLGNNYQITKQEYDNYVDILARATSVRLWSAPDFNPQGNWQDVTYGNYPFIPQDWAVDDRDIEGLQVAPGYKAVLYTEPDFQGVIGEFIPGNYPDLKVYRNRVRSLRVVNETVSVLREYGTFWTEPDFRGVETKLQVGEYPRISDEGLTTDGIGSMVIPPGYAIRMYSGEAGQGSIAYFPSGTYKSTVEYAFRNQLLHGGDKVQSIAFFPLTVPSLIIYYHPNFQGPNYSIPLVEGYVELNCPDSNLVGWPHNHFGSFKIPAGWQLTLYQWTNYGGESVTYEGDVTDNIAYAISIGAKIAGDNADSYKISKTLSLGAQAGLVNPPLRFEAVKPLPATAYQSPI
jgi:hypothetical protein